MKDISAWLETHGLGRYAAVFAEHEVDLHVLPQLTDEDVRELGLPLGPRRKLLVAIASLKNASDVSDSGQRSDSTATPKPPAVRQAERRQLTVMFVDLVGSTALSTQLDPEDLRELIVAYQNTVAGEITRFEGYTARHMGDGVLAYFGWPLAHEDEAERAVRAGLAIATAVSKLKTPAGTPLVARVGIATGVVVVGDLIGKGVAQEEAAVGETPNLAARLQELASPGTVVISKATRRLCSGVFDLESVGVRQLKGIAQPVEAYCVLDERVVENRYQAQQTEAVLPLIGREQELAELNKLWLQARSSSGQMVLLTGEAGIGKSRVLRALDDALVQEPKYRIACQCSPYHSDSALHPAIQQLARAAEFDADDSNDTQLDKLEKLFELAGDEPQQSTALIAALLGIDGESRYGKIELTPQQMRIRTLQALVSQLVGLSSERPVLFVLEDAHWSDPTTLELVEQLLVAIGKARVLMLITARPTFEHRFSAYPNLTHIVLNRLSRTASLSIIERLSGGKALPEELVEEIIRKTDGVPLFVEELTKTVLESGVLRPTKKAYVIDAPLGDIDIPSSLHDSLMARLDRLQPYKEVAQVAACLGREFDYPLLASVSPLDDDELTTALDGLVAAELMFRRGAPPDARYLFKHALVRDAAYQSLLKATRQQLHARILEALDTTHGDVSVEVCAHHAVQANLWDKAVNYLSRAGQEAMSRSAHREAANHLKQTLYALEQLPETPDRIKKSIDVRLDLRNCLMPIGEPESELHYVYEAAKLAETLNDVPRQARAACYECILLFHTGKARLALRPGQQAVTWAEALDDLHLQIPSYFYLGQVHFSLGNYPQAIALFERAVLPLQGARCFESFGLAFLPATQPRAWAAMSHAELGNFSEGIEWGNTAIEIADSADHPFSQVTSYSGLGNLYLRRGDMNQALALLERSLALSQTWELSVLFPPIASSLGSAYVLSGQIDQGLELLEHAASHMIPGRSVHWYVQCIGALSRTYLLAGRERDARVHVAKALAVSRERQERGNEAWALRLYGEIEARSRQPDLEQAQRYFNQSLSIAEDLGMRPLVAHCCFGIAVVHKQLRRFEQSRAELSAATEQYRALGMNMEFFVSQLDHVELEPE